MTEPEPPERTEPDRVPVLQLLTDDAPLVGALIDAALEDLGRLGYTDARLVDGVLTALPPISETAGRHAAEEATDG